MGGSLSRTCEESSQRERICSAICLYYARLHGMGPEVIVSVYECIAHAQVGDTGMRLRRTSWVTDSDTKHAV
jgi:hypothetical protein